MLKGKHWGLWDQSLKFISSLDHLQVEYPFSSVQFSCSVMSDSLRPHGLQHVKTPCPSLTPRVHSNSCPLSLGIGIGMPSNHLILSSCPQSSPVSGSFLMIQSLHQVAKVWSFSFNISPSNEYSGLISFEDWLVPSPCSPRDSQESSPTPQFKASILQHSAFFMVHLTSIHNYWKNHSFD